MLDARGIRSDSAPPADVCIIGGGPAGIAHALSLSGRGLRIVILEAGGERPSVSGQRQLTGDQTGTPYWRLDNSRYLALGGSANRWGGISRPLDPIDFEARSWVPNGGWPMSYADLGSAFARTADFLDLPTTAFSPPDATEDGTVVHVDDEDFVSIGYQTSPLIEFGRRILPKLNGAPDVTVITNAYVTELVMRTDADLVDEVLVRTTAGTGFSLRPTVTVLAAGAVENARLMLASRRQRPAGIGNEHDTVGRYFMEHIHAPLGHLLTTPKSRNWSTYDLTNPKQPKMRAALSPTESALRRHELLSASVAVGPATYGAKPPFITWGRHLTTLVERVYFALDDRGGRSKQVAARGVNLARTAWGAISERDLRRQIRSSAAEHATDEAAIKSLYVRGEQLPLASNRVTLAPSVDALGRPRAALHWVADEESMKNNDRVLGLFAEVARRQGLGEVVGPFDNWREQIVGGPHQMGTTRMSADPREGVVDATGQVHGIPNLFVVGSSLFPTGGHANPTFTLVALSYWVSDTVAERAPLLRAATPAGA